MNKKHLNFFFFLLLKETLEIAIDPIFMIEGMRRKKILIIEIGCFRFFMTLVLCQPKNPSSASLTRESSLGE